MKRSSTTAKASKPISKSSSTKSSPKLYSITGEPLHLQVLLDRFRQDIFTMSAIVENMPTSPGPSSTIRTLSESLDKLLSTSLNASFNARVCLLAIQQSNANASADG